MCHSIKKVVFSRIRGSFIVVEQRQFPARRMTNFERPLIEVPGTGPQAIGSRPISCTIDAMAPYTFSKIDPFPGFDHVCWRCW